MSTDLLLQEVYCIIQFHAVSARTAKNGQKWDGLTKKPAFWQVLVVENACFKPKSGTLVGQRVFFCERGEARTLNQRLKRPMLFH